MLATAGRFLVNWVFLADYGINFKIPNCKWKNLDLVVGELKTEWATSKMSISPLSERILSDKELSGAGGVIIPKWKVGRK